MNTITSFRELHQKKKKELIVKECDTNEATALEKMLLSISLEIKHMDPNSLLKTVNPEIEAIEEIEQIQNYCNLIEKEIENIVNIIFINWLTNI
jgi:hypothetical protein